MSVFGITLTLVLLGTIAAAHTDCPVLWLLIGPAPLGVGFTVIAFLRHGFIRHRSLPTVRERNYCGGDQSTGVTRNAAKNRRKAYAGTTIVPGF